MGLRLRFSLVVRCSASPIISPRSVRELMLHRQVEMFAGVAASSMPTVHQFFARHNFSLRAVKWSSLKSILIHSPFGSAKEKLRDSDQSLTEWSKNSKHPSKGRKGTKKNDLESESYERKTSRLENSQIRLTRDVIVTREPLNESSFRSVNTDRHW